MSLTSDKKLDQFETESPIRAFATFDVAGQYAVGKGFRPSLQHLPMYLDAMLRKEGWQLVQIIEADAPTMIFMRGHVGYRIANLAGKPDTKFEADVKRFLNTGAETMNKEEFAKTFTMTFTGQMTPKEIALAIDMKMNYRVIATLPDGMTYEQVNPHLRFFTMVAANNDHGVQTLTLKHINPPARSGGSEYPHIREDDIHYIGRLYDHPLIMHGHPPKEVVREARQFLSEKLLPKGVMPELAGRVTGKSPVLGMPYAEHMKVNPDEAYTVMAGKLKDMPEDSVLREVWAESIPTKPMTTAAQSLDDADDPVNPKHYNGTACAELGERMTANSYQVLKYNWRLGEKDDELVELDKSLWYLKREMQLLPRVPAEDYPDHRWVEKRLEETKSVHAAAVAAKLVSWNRYGKLETLKLLRTLLESKRAQIVACRACGDCPDRGRGLEP